MFKVKDCSFCFPFLKLVSSSVIATSHLLFQISKIVSEPHLIIRWRQCSNDLDLKTLCMDYMFELYTLYYDLCSLLESECLHIFSWYHILKIEEVYIWTMDMYSCSYLLSFMHLVCQAGILNVFILWPIHFPPSYLPAKCWPCVDSCKSGRSCNSPSQCLVSNSCIFAQACNISMSRARETELTDLQPAHMLQLLLHANKIFESDSTLRYRHIHFL